MTGLTLRRVAIRVGTRRLFAPLSFMVEPGTVTSIIGRSGAGKSSLLAFLCGLLKPPLSGDGEILLAGRRIDGLPPQSRKIGLMFQDALLFPHLSVSGNLGFGLRPGLSRDDRRDAIHRALASLSLAGYEERDPSTLSGGERTRVALLRMMLAEPHCVLLDEPFASLDPETRAVTRTMVFEELRRRRLPALMVTHDRQDVDFAGGPVVALGAPGE